MLTHEYLNRFNTVLIDTCTVMQPVFIAFLKSIDTNSCKTKISVPQSVIDELQRIAEEKSERGTQARSAITTIKSYIDNEILSVVEHESNYPRPDEFFLAYAPRRLNERILYITQDYALCRDLVGMNRSASCFGYPITVKRMSKFGYLQDFDMSRIPKAMTALSDRTNAKSIFQQLTK